MNRMDNDIGLAILQELRLTNMMLDEIYKKNNGNGTLLRIIATLLLEVHDINLSDLGFGVDEEDSENDNSIDK